MPDVPEISARTQEYLGENRPTVSFCTPPPAATFAERASSPARSSNNGRGQTVDPYEGRFNVRCAIGDSPLHRSGDRLQVKMMLTDVTRSRLIQVWFATVLLIAVACVAFGLSVTVSTGAMLLAMSLVPLAVAVWLWPKVQPPTVGDVLRGTDRRD